MTSPENSKPKEKSISPFNTVLAHLACGPYQRRELLRGNSTWGTPNLCSLYVASRGTIGSNGIGEIKYYNSNPWLVLTQEEYLRNQLECYPTIATLKAFGKPAQTLAKEIGQAQIEQFANRNVQVLFDEPFQFTYTPDGLAVPPPVVMVAPQPGFQTIITGFNTKGLPFLLRTDLNVATFRQTENIARATTMAELFD